VHPIDDCNTRSLHCRRLGTPLHNNDALDELIVHLPDHPQLRDLAWNRTDEYLPAKEAFQLYERNWRFVEPGRLDPAVTELYCDENMVVVITKDATFYDGENDPILCVDGG
jgi:hypothetical protein